MQCGFLDKANIPCGSNNVINNDSRGKRREINVI